MSDLKILVKLPSRGRPKQCGDVIRAMQSMQDVECEYLVSLDHDDPSVEAYSKAFEGLDVWVKHGKSESKIHAINRDVNGFDEPWDILVVGSDDMFPVAQGWDTIIREAMALHFHDLGGMLWFPDGYQKQITTMPIMGRRWFNRFGHVYHPSYRSFFCDNEQTEVAQAHGKLVYIDKQLFDHRHPDNGVRVKRDDTYTKSTPDWNADKANYIQRRAKGFPQ